MVFTRLSLAALIALACVHANAQTDETSKPKPQQKPGPKYSRPVPKEASPFDNVDVKSTDTGDKVQQRLKFGLDKDKDIFLYGNRATIYPSDRKPGEDYQPRIPLSTPKDSFGVGIGFGKKF